MYEQGQTNDNINQSVTGSYQSKSLSEEDVSLGNSNLKSGVFKNEGNNTFKDDNISVLNEVYQNSVMGKQSISSIIPKVEDESFKKELLSCYEKYERLCSKSSSEIMKMGEKPREKNPLTKAMLWGTVNVTAIVDSSPSSLANMMIKGSHNSISNITRAMNQYSDNIDENVKNLANDYIKDQQDNINNLQKYL